LPNLFDLSREALGDHVGSILIVEDEPTVLMLVESILQGAGYETLTAGTLAQAQAVLTSEEKIDLVFTDVQLVDQLEGGILIGEMVRQLRPGTPVIYATARSLTDGMQAQLVEPSAFVQKPYTDENVLMAVAKFLRRTNQKTP
jgi:CheY-like chemotaxis protein